MTIQTAVEGIKVSVFQENVKIPQQMFEEIMTFKHIFLEKCQNGITND